MSLDTLKFENGLCRCCHSDGNHRNLAEPWMHLGRQEIYVDMLQECLNIRVNSVQGPLCTVTYTICEDCILRLRDACNFKQQVEKCEEQFYVLYAQNAIKLGSSYSIDVKEEKTEDVTEVDIKPNMYPFDEADDDLDYSHDGDDRDYDVEIEIKKEQKSRTKKVKTKDKSKAKPKGSPRKHAVKSKGEDAEKEKKGNRHQDYYHRLLDKYACNHCDRTFTKQASISQHYRFVHLKRIPRERKCAYCDLKITDYLRSYHLEEAHGIPAPSCGVCQRRFRYPSDVLRHHKKVHMGERTVICNVCKKGFFDNLTLKSHLLIHSNEKRFECDLCGQRFRWKNNLKDHILVHMGEKKFECHVCRKSYVHKSSLKKHARRNHN